MRVLIVDDSATFRTQIRRVLEQIPGVEVVGSASNGKIALSMIEQKNVDLMTLDMNMPEMNGLETMEELKRIGSPCDVIVFASKTARSARDTLTALRNGALDFVVKPEGETLSIENAFAQVKAELAPRIDQISTKRKAKTQRVIKSEVPSASRVVKEPVVAERKWRPVDIEIFKPSAIVVASSTGGPAALEHFLGAITGATRVPIMIAQHMPATFTKFLAKRLQDITNVPCREADNGEEIQPNKIYVAPGNYHMRIFNSAGSTRLQLDQGPKVNNVRPAADLLFASAAEIYGSKCMAFVLTGMGDDGCVGAQRIKQSGGGVMIQDEHSCAVWGMPAAVFRCGAYDKIGDLQAGARVIANMCAA